MRWHVKILCIIAIAALCLCALLWWLQQPRRHRYTQADVAAVLAALPNHGEWSPPAGKMRVKVIAESTAVETAGYINAALVIESVAVDQRLLASTSHT